MVGGDVVGGEVVGRDVAGGDVVGGEVTGGAVGGGEVSGGEVAGGDVVGGAVAEGEVLRDEVIGGEVVGGDVVGVGSSAEIASLAEVDSLAEVEPLSAALESVLFVLLHVAALAEAGGCGDVGFVASTTDRSPADLPPKAPEGGKIEKQTVGRASATRATTQVATRRFRIRASSPAIVAAMASSTLPAALTSFSEGLPVAEATRTTVADFPAGTRVPVGST